MATETIKFHDPAQEHSQAEALARRYRCEFIDLKESRFDADLFRTVPVDLMFRYHFVPLHAYNGTLEIALSDPRQITLIDELSVLLGKKLKIRVATHSQISDLLKKTEKPDSGYTQGERNNRAVFLERLGTVYRDEGKYPEAVDVFRRPRCLKITVGIEVRLLMKLEDRTMHLVSAGLRQDGYNASARATILRAEVIRLNIELIDCIRVWNDVAGSTNAGHVNAAVEIVGNLSDHVVAGSVNNHVLHRETDRVLVLNVLHTRGEIQQLVDIAAD